MAPVTALEKVLRQANGGFTRDALGLVEMSEVSAAQALALRDAFDLDDAALSPDGGALARGHPLGAASAVSVVRLLRQWRAPAKPAATLRRRHAGRHRRARCGGPVREPLVS